MALNIKNTEVERLAREVAHLAGESKTEAIRIALEERKLRLESRRSTRTMKQLMSELESQIWSHIPEEFLGKGLAYLPVDDILGFGEDGV